jgi:hypothetical protein
MKTFKEMRDYFIEQLQKKGFYVDNSKCDNDFICFSLTNVVGLTCVYAEISFKEIQHAVDTQDGEEVESERISKEAWDREIGEGWKPID